MNRYSLHGFNFGYSYSGSNIECCSRSNCAYASNYNADIHFGYSNHRSNSMSNHSLHSISGDLQDWDGNE